MGVRDWTRLSPLTLHERLSQLLVALSTSTEAQRRAMSDSLPNIKDAWTSFFIGLLLCSALYGATVGQAAWYYSVYKKDSGNLLALVGLLIALDTVHMIILSIAAFFSITSWTHASKSLTFVSWSFPTSVAITYIITLIVQCFFVSRIWILSRRNRVITALITICALLQIASGMATVARETQSPILDITTKTKVAATIELSSSLVADIAITFTLVYYLNRGRSAMDYSWVSNSVVNRLIFYAVSTGLLNSIVTGTNLILFVTSANKFHWVIPHVISSKLYVNSLLATLNSRRAVQDLISRNSRIFPTPPQFSSPPLALNLEPEDRKEKVGGHEEEVEQDQRYGPAPIVTVEIEREYDPSLAYEHDLLPPSPPITGSGSGKFQYQPPPRSHRASSTRLQKPKIDVTIPEDAVAIGLSTSYTPKTPTAFSNIMNFPKTPSPSKRRRSSKGTTLSPTGTAPSITWTPPSAASWHRESDLSMHSSRLTALSFGTGTITRASNNGLTSPLSPTTPGRAFANLSNLPELKINNEVTLPTERIGIAVEQSAVRSFRSSSRASSKHSLPIGPASTSMIPRFPLHLSSNEPRWSSKSSKSSNTSKSALSVGSSVPQIGSLKFPSEIHLDRPDSLGVGDTSIVSSLNGSTGKLSRRSAHYF